VVQTFESLDEILTVTTQMKATEQYFPVVLFITLYNLVVTFESVHEIQKWDHLNERCWAVLSCSVFIMLTKVSLTFECDGMESYSASS